MIGAVDGGEGLHVVGAEAARRAIGVGICKECDQFAVALSELIERLDGVVPVVAVVERQDDAGPGEDGVDRAPIGDRNWLLIELREELVH